MWPLNAALAERAKPKRHGGIAVCSACQIAALADEVCAWETMWLLLCSRARIELSRHVITIASHRLDVACFDDDTRGNASSSVILSFRSKVKRALTTLFGHF